MSECIICRSVRRNQITCEYCEFRACSACCEQYLLSRTIPTCMAPECKREWTRKFMAKNLTKVFMAKKYKTHRETIIAEQQIALLPATQPEIIRIQELARIKKEIDAFDQEIRNLYVLRNAKQAEYHTVRDRRLSAQPRERREFVRHCPAADCKGFLSTQWKCGICHIWCCPTCHEIKGEDKNVEHTCDPNVVKSVREIGSTSKNCPKCHVPIFKIEGCDQMWCTLCEVYFSWRTGEIDTSGRYHNPHALEALRRRNREGLAREPGDIICGRELTYGYVTSLDRQFDKIITNTVVPSYRSSQYSDNIDSAGIFRKRTTSIIRMIRHTIHIRGVEMTAHRVNIDQKNMELRIDYMMNRITMDEFKYKLQCLNKKHMKSHEIHQVFDMLVVSITDIIYRFSDYLETVKIIPNVSFVILDEIPPICDFANECFCDIQIAYGGVVPQVDYKLNVGKYYGPESSKPTAATTTTTESDEPAQAPSLETTMRSYLRQTYEGIVGSISGGGGTAPPNDLRK